ncbi:MAG: hypothetical protein QXI32_05450 [Candidatus Bathyarchaeia archaeon]
MGEMIILGSKARLSAAEAIEGETRVVWHRDNPEEVKFAAETFNKYVLEGWLAFSVESNKKTQIFIFNKDLERIILAPIMFGG